jgi:hypothetical protein
MNIHPIVSDAFFFTVSTVKKNPSEILNVMHTINVSKPTLINLNLRFSSEKSTFS